MKLLCVVAYFLYLAVSLNISESNALYTNQDERRNSFDSGFFVYQDHISGNENFVFSPLSLRIILSLLYESSVHRTKQTLENLLYQKTPDPSHLLVQTKYFRHNLASPSIQSANKIYLKSGFELNRRFKNVAALYSTEIESIRFKGDAAQSINHWIENKTHGLIAHAINPNSITRDTTLIAINVLYFTAQWHKKFNLKNRIFNDVNNVRHKIKFATARGTFSLAVVPKISARILEIPYEEKSNLVFWIILPDPQIKFESIRQQLSYKFVQEIRQNLYKRNCQVEFPIFKFENKLNGNQIFPDIFKRPEYVMLNTEPLILGELQQETKIIVSEHGTEAASVTHASMNRYPSPRAPTPSWAFVADRPFIFAVVTPDDKDFIFMGHFVKP